ncbi:hypothetical protein HF895_01880 [Bacteroides sp. AN502]|nr:hypothetical protein [Caecibacteroides pullorum]MDC6279344.1 hypothetical protein [Caecibacteroides pullorum]
MSEIICGKTMDGARFVVWTNESIYVNKTNTLLCEVESSAFVQVKRCFLFIITGSRELNVQIVRKMAGRLSVGV